MYRYDFRTEAAMSTVSNWTSHDKALEQALARMRPLSIVPTIHIGDKTFAHSEFNWIGCN